MIGKEDSGCHMNQIDFLINGQYISNSNTIANSFNNYFSNVGNSLLVFTLSDNIFSYSENHSVHLIEISNFLNNGKVI